MPAPSAVAAHYDELDIFYREIWGEHVHHGFWVTGRESPEEAVKTLVHRVADWAEVTAGTDVCDIGCGYGGTGRLLADQYGARVTGITLSLAQLEFAQSASRDYRGVQFVRGDWMNNSFPGESFDAAVAIESTEHMPDLAVFYREALRVLRPGGRLVVCTWLSADRPRRWQRKHLLEPICREGRLAGLASAAEYIQLSKAGGFQFVRFENISPHVRKTWPLCAGRVVRSLIRDAKYRKYLVDATKSNRIFALSILRIWLAYRTGAMQYGLLKAQKPDRISG